MTATRRPAGYALLEVVIIILVLAVVASTVGPRLVVASYTWRNSRLTSHLQGIRQHVEQYKTDHNGQGPHLNELGQIDAHGIIARLTNATYSSGKLSRNGSCGPYMQEWPANPFTDDAIARTIKLGLAEISPRDDTTGWYYNVYTCLVSPNSPEGARNMDPQTPAPSAAICRDLSSPQIMLLGLRLTAIMEGPDGKVAVINGEPMRVGQKIMGAAITDIGRYHVELEGDGRHITVGMVPDNAVGPTMAPGSASIKPTK